MDITSVLYVSMTKKESHIYKGNFKGLLFISCYRVAHNVSSSKIKRILFCPIWILYRLVFNWILGIDVSEHTQIGKNCVVWHGVGLIIHPQAIIGDNCILRHNTTIGNTTSGGGAPIIYDGVDIGANCVVIGEIVIGKNVTIGAGSVVAKNIPDNAIVIGNPARILKYKE